MIKIKFKFIYKNKIKKILPRICTEKKLKYLVIHCTATPEGMNVRPQQIIDWHTKPKPFGRGWKQVGYSKLLLLDGYIHSFVDEDRDEFVDEWEITNGVSGINIIARHICYVGGCDKEMKPKDTRTAEQIDAMVLYLKEFKKEYPWVEIYGHYYFAAKACPSFDVEKFKSNFEL